VRYVSSREEERGREGQEQEEKESPKGSEKEKVYLCGAKNR